MNPISAFTALPILPIGGPSFQSPAEQPPARVRVAVEFLQNLNFKTMDRIAVTDIEACCFDGDELSPTEECARDAACDLLTDYFMGKLKPSLWEQKAISDKDPRSGGMVIRCMACGTVVQQDCIFCKGTGSLLVFSTVSGGEG